MDNEKKIEIPFGAFDSELIRQEINIPNGFKAVIDGNKIILTRAESEDEEIKKAILNEMTLLEKECVVEERKEVYRTWISWLEKQGKPAKLSEEEQNRFAKVVLSSCASSFIYYLDAHKYEGKMCVSNGEYEDIENAFQNAMWDRLHRYYCKYIEKQGEPNPYSGTSFEYNGHTWGMCARDNGVDILCDKHIIGHLEKQGESYTKRDVDNAYIEGMAFAKEELDKQKGTNIFDVPKISIKDAVEVTSRIQYIEDDMKPIAEFIMDYANWDLHKDEWNQPTLTVPLFRVLDALIQRGKPYCECSQNSEKQGEQKPADTVEQKCEESKTKIYDAPTSFEERLFAFVAGCEFLTLPAKIEFIKEHSQELLDAAKEQTEKKYKEDMELKRK